MRGEEDRECRARGGKVGTVFAGKGSAALKAFKGGRSKNTPDATLARGSGPLFRKRGGSIPESFKEHEFSKGEDGDREEKAAGGAISGAASKPNAGRPGRRVGGGVGADLSPVSSAQTPSKPKGRKLMGESEKTP
jgi:hypothetical protein